MAKQIVVSNSDYVYITPETVLETRLISGGPVVSSIPVPAKEFKYPKGSEHTFSTKKSAKSFVDFHNANGGNFSSK